MTDNPFWIDWKYDREMASNGHSRYASYLRDAAAAFNEIYADDPTAEFAAIAWRYARGPIMSPGLVRDHARVVSASVQRSDWNGRLVGVVQLVAPAPQSLANARTPEGRWFRDITLDSWAGRYNGVGGRELETASYLTTVVEVLWQMPENVVPAVFKVPDTDGLRYQVASTCVTDLVAEMNRYVGPIIEALEK